MTDADARFLTSLDAQRWLRLAAGALDPLKAAKRLRKELSADQARRVIEQAGLRRRGAEKFALAEQMYFTRVGFEQATDEAVAKYKAARFPVNTPLADLCCGVGGDLMALAERGSVVGVERDSAVVHMAEANARLAGNSARVVVAEADQFSVAGFAAWHLDPDRRREGKRTTRVALHDPRPEVLARLLNECPSAAIKLAPAADIAVTALGGADKAADAPWHEAELEWISRNRECRQLVAWFGSLTRESGWRRATAVLNDIGDHGPVHAESFVGEPETSTPIAQSIRRYVFEPDAAVLVADLSGALAQRYELQAVSAKAAYLTADAPIITALLAAFEVIEVLPYHAGKLKSWLRARSIGNVEVKKRGVEIDPARVQRELSGDGDDSATVLLCPIQKRVTAIVARRI
jgi:hypothetical protein